MPQELSKFELGYARALLESAGPSAMYDYLAAKGYQYAKLANGFRRAIHLQAQLRSVL